MSRHVIRAAMFLLLSSTPLLAQQTTGNIAGRVTDQQGSAVPGATITAKNPQTGFTRTETSDAEGVYRLTALPVGVYDVTAELQGFQTFARRGIDVSVRVGSGS
jgi:Carboxypeptidase regulatory-like domain